MKRIDEFKVSLMSKDADFEIDEKGKGNYIIKETGTFNAKKFFEEKEVSDDEYMEFIERAMVAIYENLPKKSGYDSIGLWITYEDGKKIDSSIEVATLDSMEAYGTVESGMLEFAKMTLDAVEHEGEVSP